MGIQSGTRGGGKCHLRAPGSRGGKVTEEEIIAFCKEKLATFKVPRAVEFRDALPKSAVGKILRRVLKEEEAAKAT
ncbi:MAG: hypothetical protein JRC86_08285 [Deltaproteobacteria bacterium]|nr:hypothetical protein [Deltaproteobacteria bacterium]